MGAAGQNRRFLAKAYKAYKAATSKGVRTTLWPDLEISPMHKPTIHRPAPNLALARKVVGCFFDLIGFDQGWEYLGTHPLGKSYLVVSYLGKDKSYLVSKPVVC